MPLSRLRSLRRIVGALGVGGAAACASAGAPMASRPFVGGTALASGERIDALPDSGTFAWVEPTRSILHTTPADDARRDEAGIPGLREDVAIVLRSHHWREVPADEAMFRLTLARIDRPDPARNNTRTDRPLPNTTLPACTGAVGERKEVNCTTRPADLRQSPDMTVTRYGSWVVLVIRRRDGAVTSWARALVWDQRPSDVDFAPQILAFLRSGRQ